MQENKKFFDIFKKYKPGEDKRALIERAYASSFRYTKDPMRVEVELSFHSHEDPELLYEIEDECRELYGAESFKILPHFPPESFTMELFSEVVCEATVCGAITNGFFIPFLYKYSLTSSR
jgi:hypothetical protein